jgi:N-acetylglutamate synthase-like GNAT family acetyltransferase
MTAPLIRRARPGEAEELSALTGRSKAHWGYDAALLAAMRPDLNVEEADILNDAVYIIERDGRTLGYCHLRPGSNNAVRLESLFVDADAIGTGLGRRLWEFGVTKARELGYGELLFESDPNAEPFYLARGAVRIAMIDSTIVPGRMIPSLRFDLR